MYEKSNSTVSTITPSQAEQWLAVLDHPEQEKLQRKVRNSRVDFLAKQMEAGKFLPTNNVHFAFFGDKTFLVNGQHTLHAVVKSGATITYNVVRTTCDTFNDVASLYEVYDIPLARTIKDSLNARNIDVITGINNEYLSRIGSTLRYIAAGYANVKQQQSLENLANGIVIFAPIFKLLESAVVGSGFIHNGGYKRAIMGAAFPMFYYYPKEAHLFWNQVANDNLLAADDSRKTLNKFLLAARISGGRTAKNSYISYSASEISKACFICWNAFFENRPLRVIRIAGKNLEASGIDLIEFREYVKSILEK